MKKFMLIIMIIFCSSISFANSDLLGRLAVIAKSDEGEILVDQFINGTEDYYIATIVRPISSVNKEELAKGMIDIIESFEDSGDIYIRELNAYSKREQSSMTLQRSLVKKPYYETPIYPEVNHSPQLAALKDGTLDKVIWEAIAGEKGLGYMLLSDDHGPVELSGNKEIIDTVRYSLATRKDGMGVYTDVNSFIKTPVGCIAWIIEPIPEILEDVYGDLVSNMIGRPFQKADVMMIKAEFDFSKPVCKTLRYIYYGKDGKIIYSSVSANPEEIDVSQDPVLNAMYNHVKHIAPDVMKN